MSFRNCDYTICGLVSCSVLSFLWTIPAPAICTCATYGGSTLEISRQLASPLSVLCAPPSRRSSSAYTNPLFSAGKPALSFSLVSLCRRVFVLRIYLSFSCISVNYLVVDRTAHGHAQQGLCRMNTVSSSLLSMTISTCVQPGSHRLGLDTPARSVT